MSGQHREGFEWESEPCPGVPVHHHTVGGQRDVPWRFLLLSDPCWYNATLKNVKGATEAGAGPGATDYIGPSSGATTLL